MIALFLCLSIWLWHQTVLIKKGNILYYYCLLTAILIFGFNHEERKVCWGLSLVAL
jgi:hypothetical protein